MLRRRSSGIQLRPRMEPRKAMCIVSPSFCSSFIPGVAPTVPTAWIPKVTYTFPFESAAFSERVNRSWLSSTLLKLWTCSKSMSAYGVDESAWEFAIKRQWLSWSWPLVSGKNITLLLFGICHVIAILYIYLRVLFLVSHTVPWWAAILFKSMRYNPCFRIIPASTTERIHFANQDVPLAPYNVAWKSAVSYEWGVGKVGSVANLQWNAVYHNFWPGFLALGFVGWGGRCDIALRSVFTDIFFTGRYNPKNHKWGHGTVPTISRGLHRSSGRPARAHERLLDREPGATARLPGNQETSIENGDHRRNVSITQCFACSFYSTSALVDINACTFQGVT